MKTNAQLANGFIKSLTPTTHKSKNQPELDERIAVNSFGLSPEQRALLTQYAASIESRIKRASEDIIEVGRMLTEAKKMLPDGQFGAWLSLELPDVSLSTASNFMRIAKAFKKEDVTGINVSAQALNELSLSYVSPKTREVALQRMRRGETLSYAKVKLITREEREANRESGGQAVGRKGIRDAFVATYESLRVECETDVETDLGLIHIVTNGACFEALEQATPEALMSAIGRIALKARAFGVETGRELNAAVVIRPTTDRRIEQIMELSESLGVSVHLFAPAGEGCIEPPRDDDAMLNSYFEAREFATSATGESA